jgi:predicted nucleic acid-binding protein
MKVYLDNNVVSSILKDDNKTQSGPLTRLLEAHEQRRVQLVTSEITLEEIRRCPKAYRPPLERTFRLLEKVPVVRWAELVGINTYGDKYTWINTPMIRNDALFDALLSLGLEPVDAQHIYVATRQTCTIFLTYDNSRRTGIIRRADGIKQLCGMVVQMPSQLVAAEGW